MQGLNSPSEIKRVYVSNMNNRPRMILRLCLPVNSNDNYFETFSNVHTLTGVDLTQTS